MTASWGNVMVLQTKLSKHSYTEVVLKVTQSNVVCRPTVAVKRVINAPIH